MPCVSGAYILLPYMYIYVYICVYIIYTWQLELKCEKRLDTQASFLDLVIKIVNKKFLLSHCDKIASFPFSIVRVPYLCSNMLSKIFCILLGSEIIRIVRTNAELEMFKSSHGKIIFRMIKQRGTKNRIFP